MQKLLAVLALLGLATLGVWYSQRGQPAREPAGVLPAQVGTVTPTGDTDAAELELKPSIDAVRTDAGTSAPLDSQAASHFDPNAERASTRTQLVGRVMDQRGVSVADAEVSIRAGHGDWPWIRRTVQERGTPDTTTDKDGRFELGTSRRGALQVRVEASGFAPRLLDVYVHDSLLQTLDDVVLSRGVVLMGQVLDHRGAQVEGAQILLPPQASSGLIVFGGVASGELMTRTDDQGFFSVDRLAVGPYRLIVRTEEHPDAELVGETSVPEEVQRDLVVRLEEGATITGKALMVPPGSGILVQARQQSAGDLLHDFPGLDGLGGARMAEVLPDSSFRVRGLRKDREYGLSLLDEGASTRATRSATIVARAGEQHVELRYTAGSTLSFQVVDATNTQPITEFEVSAGVGWTEVFTGPDSQPLRTHASGIVRIEGLRPRGEERLLTLTINAVGYAAFERRDIEVAHEGAIDLGQIALTPVPVVRVTVRSKAVGEPIEGASVELRAVHDNPALLGDVRFRAMASSSPAGIRTLESATTLANGVATLNSMPDQRVSIVVQAAGFARAQSEEFTLPAEGDATHEILLTRGGGVRVLVQNDAGEPMPALGVRHRQPGARGPSIFTIGGGAMHDATADEQGIAYFDNLAPGMHAFQLVESKPKAGPMAFVGTLELEGAPEDTSIWNEVLVEEGEVAELVLYARSRGRLSGHVLEGGVPLAGARLTLREPATNSSALVMHGFPGSQGPETTTDGDGRYLFEDQAAGDYELVVEHLSRAMEEVFEAEVEGGENLLDVVLSLCVVEGTVRDGDGKPLAGARVEVKRKNPAGQQVAFMARMVISGDDDASAVIGSGVDRRTTTDAEGRFVLRGLPAGVELELEASHPSWQTQRSQPFELQKDEHARDRDLKLPLAGKIVVFCRRPDGSPAANALLRASFLGADSGPAEPKLQITSKSGRCEFVSLQPGRWQVSVQSETLGGGSSELAPREVEVLLGQEHELTFDLTK